MLSVIKMVLDDATRRIVGVSMLGMSTGEVIHEAAMALRFGATTDGFTDLIHVYPMMTEALKLVAISFTTDVNRLSCCASESTRQRRKERDSRQNRKKTHATSFT